FELDSVTADPVPLDESEGISDFRWVPRQEMSAVAEHLKSLDHHSRELGDWGRFRAVAHEFILKVT
ncbi:MAG: hypothetical protein K8T25_06995, partial [Planctomycetia bacterium]|nr:hypothetical protein [Planctomycetia bacterium]